MNPLIFDTPVPSIPSIPKQSSIVRAAPGDMKQAFTILLVRGNQTTVIAPLLVSCVRQEEMVVSRALGRFEAVARSARESLIDLQEMMEWEYLDLAEADPDSLTGDAKDLLNLMSAYFTPLPRH